MRPKPRRCHRQLHEKRFKIRRKTGRRGCRGCYDPRDFGGVRAERTAAFKTGRYDDAPLSRWTRNPNHRHDNGAKHNRHAHSTRARETYRIWAKRKLEHRLV